MTFCDINDLDRALGMSIGSMEKCGLQPSAVEELRTQYEGVRPAFNEPAVSYCVERYIDAELDHRTPGPRGIGRASKHIPRFGYFFRKYLAQLSPEELVEIKGLIRDMMLQAYLAHALAIEESLADPVYSSGDDLFNAWILTIYATDISKLGAINDIMGNFAYPGWELLADFMRKKGMDPGKSKVKVILAYHMLAGYALRRVEMVQNP